jgi:hypothetical protein
MDSEKKSTPNPWIAIIISIAAFLVSSINMYFTQFYTSETLYAVLLDFDLIKISSEPRIQTYDATGVEADVVLVNSGNQNIIVSNVELCYWLDERNLEEMREKTHIPEFASPILLGPRQVHPFRIRFTFDNIPIAIDNIPVQVQSAQSDDYIEEYESYVFALVFTTIGSSGKLEKGVLEVGSVLLRDRKYEDHTKALALPVKLRN